MPVPTPPRINTVEDLPSIVAAIKIFQQYLTQIWNAVRPAAVRSDAIAAIDELVEAELADVAFQLQAISNPPTQAEVAAIQATLNIAIVRLNDLRDELALTQQKLNEVLAASRTQISG